MIKTLRNHDPVVRCPRCTEFMYDIVEKETYYCKCGYERNYRNDYAKEIERKIMFGKSKKYKEPTVYPITGKHYMEINTVNGIIDEGDLKANKLRLINNKIQYYLDELLPHTNTYPDSKTNTTMVNINTDLVVLKREEYDDLIKQLDNE